jgi:hypothetical protein
MNQIIQYHGKLHQGDMLFEALKEEYFGFMNSDDFKDCKWYLVVYLWHNQKAEIVYYSASAGRHEGKQSFHDCLEMIDRSDFRQILMLLTLFPWNTGKRKLKKIFTPRKAPFSPLDQILADTNGWILYRQQFESLIQLAAGVTALEAIRIRKDYNAKKPKAFALFEKHELFGENLGQIISNRCIVSTVSDLVFYIKGAVRLYENIYYL